MARDRDDEAAVRLPRVEHEPADDALAALEVAVEEVDRERAACGDGLARGDELCRARVTVGALPEADVSGGDVEVAREPGERRRIERRVAARHASHGEPPAVEHGDPGAGVPERDREVDRLVGRLGDGAAARHLEPLQVGEPDPLRGILAPRGDEQRPQPGEERPLGDAGRPVRRLHRGEGRRGEHERPDGSRERGDRHPAHRPSLARANQSGRRDSNSRPPAPKAGALPGCATSRAASVEGTQAGAL